MLIVWILVAVAACVVSGIGAAGYMHGRLQRQRLLAEIEDPRDTQIRELLVAVKVARENETRASSGREDHLDELSQARDRIKTLEKLSAGAAGEAETMQGRLESLLGERNQLEENLAGMRRDNERLHNRVQELEMELSVGRTGDLLAPELQAS